MTHVENDPCLKEAIRDLTRHIAHLKSERNIPGCCVGIVHDRELIWNEAFGLADHSKGIPVSPHTGFKIASLTKLFTASLLMILRQDGL